MAFVATILAVIISIFTEKIKKEIIEDIEFLKRFDRYSKCERIEDLLLDEIMRCENL